MSYHCYDSGGEEQFYFATEFHLTKVHLRLLRRLVLWFNPDTSDDYYYDGFIQVDCKRPYGNSAVENDILEEIYAAQGKEMWDCYEDTEDGYEDFVDEHRDEIQRIHREMGQAMTVIFESQCMKPGRYVRRAPHAPFEYAGEK